MFRKVVNRTSWPAASSTASPFQKIPRRAISAKVLPNSPQLLLEGVNTFAERGDGERARSAFEQCRDLLPLPNRTMGYNTVLKAFANSGDSGGATKWLNIMVEHGVRLNGKTFGKLAESCAKNGDLRGAERWLARSTALKFEIDSVTS